jgi:TIR domain
MPDYEYDIFVSYVRQDKYWMRWTRENFVRPLRSLLSIAIGNVQIFVDDRVETGSSWPVHLAHALARSRLLMPILSRAYFASDWCRLELTYMYQREQKLRLRTAEEENGLILPFVIDDGASFPSEIRAIHAEEIHDFANPFMQTNSRRQEAFTERLRELCPRIERALQSAPPFDPAWATLTYDDQTNEMFRIKAVTQKTLPALSPPFLSPKELSP